MQKIILYILTSIFTIIIAQDSKGGIPYSFNNNSRTNIITIKPGQKKTRHVSTGKVDTLVLDDAKFIEKHVSLITGVAAEVYRSALLKFGNKNTITTVRGRG